MVLEILGLKADDELDIMLSWCYLEEMRLRHQVYYLQRCSEKQSNLKMNLFFFLGLDFIGHAWQNILKYIDVPLT